MSWLSKLTDRVREGIENVQDTLSTLLRGKSKEDDSQSTGEVDLRDVLHRGPIDSTSSAEIPEPDEFIEDDEPEPTYPVQVPAQEQRFQPESFPPEDDGEPDEDEDENIETVDENQFAASELRRIFVFLEDALAYADDIPVPTEVFRRKSDGLYQVRVIYP